MKVWGRIVTASVIVGSLGGLLLGWYFATLNDDEWFTPCQLGTFFAIPAGLLGLVVGYLLGGLYLFWDWLRHRR